MWDHDDGWRNGTVSPSRRWNWLVVSVAVGGIILSGFLLWRAMVALPTVKGQFPAGESTTVTLETEGITVFADRENTRFDCIITDHRGQTIPSSRPTTSETITINQDSWHAILRSDTPVRPGTFTVACADNAGTAVWFAVGPHASLFGFLGNLFGAIFVFIAGIGGAIFLAIVLKIMRERNQTHWDSA
ncbi:hypothetical protein IEU95_12105 [Hoyosella rhizosphaerae]|uniref:Uncharacterized protein n=1 Tax=Hoyosella rhizosphaerae TaxID=1755582 RepID=A0A916U8S3_9ACTN|nr:hypothetical protein [Hoyosella rhizosphaerae]MBN4927577.1 hypothetical protein [Hoyosella rhizosphaerae]GGC63379.1 hypothetical protein GCM10011410_14780 [Hoyosella rhizosphaerae]